MHKVTKETPEHKVAKETLEHKEYKEAKETLVHKDPKVITQILSSFKYHLPDMMVLILYTKVLHSSIWHITEYRIKLHLSEQWNMT